MHIPYKEITHPISSDNGTLFTVLYSLLQRGIIENPNGLIRQYITNKKYFYNYNYLDINETKHKLNRIEIAENSL